MSSSEVHIIQSCKGGTGPEPEIRHNAQSDARELKFFTYSVHGPALNKGSWPSDWQLEEEGQKGDTSRVALCGGWAADGHRLERQCQSGRRQRSRLMGTVDGHPQGVLDRQVCSLGTLWGQLFVQESR